MTGMPLVRAFEDIDDDVEIIWPGRFFRHGDEWHVRTSIRRARSDLVEGITLPIGLMPVLAPGRCFSGGMLTGLTLRGEGGDFTVESLAAGTRCTSTKVPDSLMALLASRRPQNSARQTVFRYKANGLEVFVPAVELVRFLFLSHKTLANAVMRPQGLDELCVMPKPGFYDELRLDFTENLPVSLLRGRGSESFVRGMAWIAVSVPGRRSWDSIRRFSVDRPRVDFEPPRIGPSTLRVRWLRSGATALVLEILDLSGRRMPCKALEYAHPSLRQAYRVRPSGKGDGAGDDAQTPESPKTKQYVIERAGTACRDADQPKTTVDVRIADIGGSVEIRRILGPAEGDATLGSAPVDAAPGDTETAGSKRAATAPVSAGTEAVKVPASVAEVAATAKLHPLEFDLLPAVDQDRVGALGPMKTLVDTMAGIMPTVQVGRRLTALVRSEKRISRTTTGPRPVLVALFTPPLAPPRALVEVDHSEGVSLSLLGLVYLVDVRLIDIERDIGDALRRLVDANGHWDRSVFDDRAANVRALWMPKVMRHQASIRNDETYALGWAFDIAKELGLGDFIAVKAPPKRKKR